MMRKFAGSFAFVSLMVFGWGSLDFFLHIPYAIIAVTALVAPFIVGVNRPKRVSPGARSVTAFLAVFGTAGIGFLPPFLFRSDLASFPVNPALQWIGVLVFQSGYLIRVLAAHSRGRDFHSILTIRVHDQLYTSGIYSWIRHPVYLGHILGAMGMMMVFPGLYGFLFLFFYTGLFLYRISEEEKFLLQSFGSVFEEYTLKTFRLIPHIY